jgi:hypothetical protein
MERQWAAIDAAGTARNAIAAAAVSAITVAAMQVFGGALILYNAAVYTLPNAYIEFKAALISDTQEGKISSGLSAMGQVLYASMGLGLLLAGAVGILNKILENPAVGHVAMVASSFLGALCVVRGAIMLGRALYSLTYLIPFNNAFKEVVSRGDRAEIEEFLRKAITEGHPEDIKRRVGAAAVEAYEKYLEEGDMDALLLAIDKGIFTQLSKQVLYITISVAMIVGGVFSLMSTLGTADILLTALIAATSWAAMEFNFLIFDVSTAFNYLVDKSYKISNHSLPQFSKESNLLI